MCGKRKILSAVNVTLMMLRSAGRANLHKPHLPPTNQNHGALLKQRQGRAVSHVKEIDIKDAREAPASRWATTILRFIMKGGGSLLDCSASHLSGVTFRQVFESEERFLSDRLPTLSLPLLHLISSGPLLAVVEGRATTEGFVLIEEQLNQQESQPQPVN